METKCDYAGGCRKQKAKEMPQCSNEKCYDTLLNWKKESDGKTGDKTSCKRSQK